MKIPVGSFGFYTPTPVDRSPITQATDRLGQIVSNVGAKVEETQRQFGAVNAMNVNLDHEVATADISNDIQRQVQAGELEPEKALSKFDSAAASIPVPKPKFAGPESIQSLQLNLKKNLVRARASISDSIAARQLAEQQVAYPKALDSILSLMEAPDADVPALLNRGKGLVFVARHAGVSEAETSAHVDAFHARAAQILAKRDPRAALAALADPSASDPVFGGLTHAHAQDVKTYAQAQLVEQSVLSVIGVFEKSGQTAAVHALAALGRSGLPPELRDDVLAHVGQNISQLRAQRRQERVDDLIHVERSIATGTAGVATERLVHSLYEAGAYSPEETANTFAQIDSSRIQAAKQNAGAEEIAAALAQGLPLDPKDADQRKALANYFAAGTVGADTGSEPWRAAAIAVANKTRMLPDQALAWTRQAMRSPSPDIAANAAQFFGAVAAGAPDATSGFDDETKAFAGTVNAMIESGTNPAKAVETARATVFETKPDIREQRKKQYKTEVKNSPSALSSLIDRDFDPGWFTSQPAASAALQSDFDGQTGRYFEKVGDIDLARKLAWSDLTRVYGPTKINGTPMITAFPPERFGVKPDEVHADIAEFLKANPQEDGSSADDVLLVPDALTLRQAGDALSGKQVRPSYSLVTKTGDAVLDAHGMRKRYTIPGSEELGKRIKSAQDAAEAVAHEQVAKAREAREALLRYRASPPPAYEPY